MNMNVMPSSRHSPSVRITLWANAGVLIEGGGRSLLVDGLYRAEHSLFPAVPRSIRAAWRAGQRPVDLLAFTHLHSDHFHLQEVNAFLSCNEVTEGLLPAGGGALRIPTAVMAGPIGQMGLWAPLPEIEVRWCNTGHMGPQTAGEANHVLLVRVSERAILVTGDADPAQKEGFQQLVAGTPVDAALVNPLFFQSREGRALLREVIRPSQVLLYHIPDRDSDPWGLGRMADRQQKRSSGEPFTVTVLDTPLQSVTV